MAETTITTPDYKLYPSPRNRHREVFAHQVFVPYPYALIDLPSFHFQGKASLFAACRLADMKMGQLVSFELKFRGSINLCKSMIYKEKWPLNR